jgi:PAS domain S-box-containing protein
LPDRPTLEETIALLEKAQQVAHIGSWVAELDGSGRCLWFPETHRILGIKDGELHGTFEALLAFVHADDRAAVRDLVAGALDRREAYEVEHRVVRPDGSLRWVRQKADFIPGVDGRPGRMVGTVQDITERHELEGQLRQSQKMEAVGRLAGGIAHDLNNALTAIAGYAELALGAIPAEHAARTDIEEIRRAAERAGSVTRQLLAFSRKQLFEPRLVDLNDLVGSLGRLLERLLGADIAIETSMAPDLPAIVGDPGQLEQAIINLSVNARDAMPSGGRITLATSFDTVDEEYSRSHMPMQPGRYVTLRVSDTGTGMSRETLTHIFEPFFTTKDPGKGTGLGLTMVYATIKQVGGFLFVESEIGRGTTFHIHFPPAPMPAVAAEPARSTAGAPETTRGPAPGGGETLLVVEDEPAVRSLVAAALGRDGFQLLLASSADEALALARQQLGAIDLLLTDAIMPGKSGIDLANALVAERPDLPVILMSGYTEQTLDMTGLSRPVSLLQKPFTPRELRQRVRDVLDGRRT